MIQETRSFQENSVTGAGYVIEELVAGKDVKLTATAYGTDCYPQEDVRDLHFSERYE